MNMRMGFDPGANRDQLRKDIQKLQKQARELSKKKDWANHKKVQAKISEKYSRMASMNHWRAAELQNPPPAGHFIREFGGSDRLVIDGGSDEASISQVLALLNGFVDNYVLRNRSSVLMRELQAAKTDEAKIILAFKMILGRSPYPWEVKDLAPQIEEGPRGADNLVWALLNTHEFMAWK